MLLVIGSKRDDVHNILESYFRSETSFLQDSEVFASNYTVLSES